MNIAIHLTRPFQEPPQAVPLGPQEFPELQESDLGHLDAGEGLDAPKKVGTAPGRNPVAASGIPDEAQHLPHRHLV